MRRFCSALAMIMMVLAGVQADEGHVLMTAYLSGWAVVFALLAIAWRDK